MQQLVDNMRMGYLQFAGNGQYLALYYITLLVLFLLMRQQGGRKDTVRENYLNISLGLTVMLLFPPSAWLLMKYQTTYYTYSNLILLLPLPGIIACGFTEVITVAEINDTKRKSRNIFLKKYKEIFCCSLLAVAAGLLFLCGTMISGEWKSNTVENGLKIPGSILEILEKIPEGRTMIAPDEVLEYARAYNGEIRLLYGRDMWNPALRAYTYDTYPEELVIFHEWLNPDEEQMAAGEMSGSKLPVSEAVRILKDECEVLVLDKKQYEQEEIGRAFSGGKYEHYADSSEYVILMRSSDDDTK